MTDARCPVLVIPCFDEAGRLDRDAFLGLAREAHVRLLLVDDGSRDGTRALLEDLREALPALIDVLALPRNQGKAEAVRQGMLRALNQGAMIVGFADADLSTPADELERIVRAAQNHEARVVLGARVALLGSQISRTQVRHYLGRLFATAASSLLRLSVYDTQCGAKVFASPDELRAALREPFLSRWAFDVELLGRLVIGAPGVAPIAEEELLEVPLRKWRDVRGSKLSAWHMARAASDLLRIREDLARRRRLAAR
jgi:glycosyltransferase involved in cell wall biosynthesis